MNSFLEFLVIACEQQSCANVRSVKVGISSLLDMQICFLGFALELSHGSQITELNGLGGALAHLQMMGK